jgi:hypothetical protein
MIATSVDRLTDSDSAAHWATVADDHYSDDSTLGAIEDQFGLGTLGQSNQQFAGKGGLDSVPELN